MGENNNRDKTGEIEKDDSQGSEQLQPPVREKEEEKRMAGNEAGEEDISGREQIGRQTDREQDVEPLGQPGEKSGVDEQRVGGEGQVGSEEGIPSQPGSSQGGQRQGQQQPQKKPPRHEPRP